VATREGIKRIVSGSIAANGAGYDLAVKIVDRLTVSRSCRDTSASGKDDAQRRRTTGQVRQGLGDKTANANQVKGPKRLPRHRLRRRMNTSRRRIFQAAKYEVPGWLQQGDRPR
jgi:hypothetical protein